MSAVASLQAFHPTPRERLAPTDLVQLAQSCEVGDRQRLLLGVVALCEASPPGAEVSPIVSEIFLTLARKAESDIRRTLAESLAAAEWAPPALIAMLAMDEIDIARPVIASSPLLQDGDLIRILVEATIEHQIEVARRPSLSGRVADVIIDAGEPATMTALASNRTAEISEAGVRRLIEQSRRVAALRSPLTRHPRLNDALARELYACVGNALRQAIQERFTTLDITQLAPAIDQAVADAGPQCPANTDEPGEDSVVDREEMERRLIAKLEASGQLRPGFLIRAIREKKLSLFEFGLASLGGFPVSHIRNAMTRGSPDALYYACTAVEIDRAVFPALLTEIRALNGGGPGRSSDRYWSAAKITPTNAVREFRLMMSDIEV